MSMFRPLGGTLGAIAGVQPMLFSVITNSYAAGIHTVIVPLGARWCKVQLDASGAGGGSRTGSGGNAGNGGRGGRVVATIPVQVGDILRIYVPSGGMGGAYIGTGISYTRGGQGGGCAYVTKNDVLMVVAGAGSGGVGSGYYSSSKGADGVPGGGLTAAHGWNQGQTAQPGTTPGTGGLGGSPSGPGTGGLNQYGVPGFAGSPLQGGDAGTPSTGVAGIGLGGRGGHGRGGGGGGGAGANGGGGGETADTDNVMGSSGGAGNDWFHASCVNPQSFPGQGALGGLGATVDGQAGGNGSDGAAIAVLS